MANFTELFGSILQQGLSSSGSSRLNNALQGGSGLNDLLGNLGNMFSQGGGNSNLGNVLSGALSSLGGNQAALGGLGALGGALLGGGSRSAKGALGGGALAMLASLAFSALNKGNQAPSSSNAMQFVGDAGEQAMEQDAEVLVPAMINAAKADGAIDEQETRKIVGKFEEDGLTEDEKQFFITEAAKPLELQRVIDSAQGRPELAAQIYAASLLAIDVDTSAEQQYMQALADGLGLQPETVEYIEASLAK